MVRARKRPPFRPKNVSTQNDPNCPTNVGGPPGSRSSESQPEVPAGYYCLQCTSCKGNYNSGPEWHDHLAKPCHQMMARPECAETWWEDPSMKECAVVIFCSFALTPRNTIPKVLKRFSRRGGYFVTDFVWFPERPRIGFLQFESGNIVTEIFKTLDGPSGYVENQLLQVRRVVDILQLEWQELFPTIVDNGRHEQPSSSLPSCNNDNLDNGSSHARTFEDSTIPNVPAEERDLRDPCNDGNTTVSVPPKPDETALAGDVLTAKLNPIKNCRFDETTDTVNQDNAPPPEVTTTTTPPKLQEETAISSDASSMPPKPITKLVFDETTGTVRMTKIIPSHLDAASPNVTAATDSSRKNEQPLPDGSTNTVSSLTAQSHLQDAVCPSVVDPSSLIPIPKSSKIINPTSLLQTQFNTICKSIEISEEELKFAEDIMNVIKDVFTKDHPSGQMILMRNFHLRLRTTGGNTLLFYMYIADNPFDSAGFECVTKMMKRRILNSNKFKRFFPGVHEATYDYCVHGGSPYVQRSTGFRFNLMTDPLTIAEAQLYRLLQYLCTFDPRVKPLLTLLYFWAKSNDIRIAEEDIPKGLYHSNCPEPTAFEYLVVLFLIREKIIPSVREILQRPHKALVACETRTDVSFSPDPEYAREWANSKTLPDRNTDEFLTSVVTLAQNFFHFYSSNLENGCWLLNPKDGELIKREGSRCHKSSLTPTETYAIGVVQESESTREHLLINNFRIFMLHPLYITWRLSFCVDKWNNFTCFKMKKAAERLEQYLKNIEKAESLRNVETMPTLEAALAGNQKKSESVRFELQFETSKNLRLAIRTKLESRKRKGGPLKKSATKKKA